MEQKQSRGRRIFWLVLIPLLLLVIMQAALSFGTVIRGGTFSTLRSYAVDRLSQVTGTRQIILEGQMVRQWSDMPTRSCRKHTWPPCCPHGAT